MVPTLLPTPYFHSYPPRFFSALFSNGLQSLSQFVLGNTASNVSFAQEFIKRDGRFDPHQNRDIAFAVLIPVLVLMSGLFAGLTLGYMSLDETQLKVLSISGTPEQREYAKKIKPIRKNGHLLLVTLLLANMIVNESLPVISDQVLGGGIQGVVVSTILIVIFAEIIPQSLFTRHGLYLGAKMAGFTRVLIIFLGVVAWPVAKLLEFALGPHHGIIYRRAELKELIALHSSLATHGGDLKTDTVTIIGATLDLQEKVVKQAMTPIDDVFMLSIDSKLDYDLLKKICQTGHSRVPVYEEVDVPVSDLSGTENGSKKERTHKVKKILGILLVKHCLLLDPKDATPLREIPLNKVPFVPNNEPLLRILDRFQEGRSHMAIVGRFSVEKAASVKKAVKRGLTQRLRERVGMGDSDSSDEEKDGVDKASKKSIKDAEEATLKDDGVLEKDGSPDSDLTVRVNKKRKVFRGRGQRTRTGLATQDIEMGRIDDKEDSGFKEEERSHGPKVGFQLPKAAASMTSMSMLEQQMPADAVLAKEGADEFLKNFDPAVMPLGIITLEDVLEELIGEEIYDEFDPQGAHGDPYEIPIPEVKLHESIAIIPGVEDHSTAAAKSTMSSSSLHVPTALKGFGSLGFLRTRSAPPIPRNMPLPLINDEKPGLLDIQADEQNGYQNRDQNLNAAPIIVGTTSTSNDPSASQNPPVVSTPSVAGAARTPSNVSPVVPIEAVILSRGRRPGLTSTGSVSGSGGGFQAPVAVSDVSTIPGRMVNPAGKGSRFKSSRLGVQEGERVGGTIIEKVKDDPSPAGDNEAT